jgi:hypothetical protein
MEGGLNTMKGDLSSRVVYVDGIHLWSVMTKKKKDDPGGSSICISSPSFLVVVKRASVRRGLTLERLFESISV